MGLEKRLQRGIEPERCKKDRKKSAERKRDKRVSGQGERGREIRETELSKWATSGSLSATSERWGLREPLTPVPAPASVLVLPQVSW